MYIFKRNKSVGERVATAYNAWLDTEGNPLGTNTTHGDLSKTWGNVEGGEMDAGKVGRVSESRGQCTFWRAEHSPREGGPQSPGGPPGCAYGRQTHLKLDRGTGHWPPLGLTAAEETGLERPRWAPYFRQPLVMWPWKLHFTSLHSHSFPHL